MKIFLTGASGMVGSRILAEAVSRGHSVVAGSRNPEKIAVLPGVVPVAVDGNDPATLVSHAKGADVWISAVAARSTGDAIPESVALGKAMIAAAKEAGVRLILVGGAGTLTLPDGTPVAAHVPKEYRDEALGMRLVRDMLRDADFDWSYFAPALFIQPGVRTGNYRSAEGQPVFNAAGQSEISAEDYAVAMIDEVEVPKRSRQVWSAAN